MDTAEIIASRTEPGYLAGAVEAAERAATEIARRLGESLAGACDNFWRAAP
jgi:hypothetical protein